MLIFSNLILTTNNNTPPQSDILNVIYNPKFFGDIINNLILELFILNKDTTDYFRKKAPEIFEIWDSSVI